MSRIRIRFKPQRQRFDKKLLKKFNREVNESRIGKVFKDHAGHLYEVDKHGSVRKLTRDELNARISGNADGGKTVSYTHSGDGDGDHT